MTAGGAGAGPSPIREGTEAIPEGAGESPAVEVDLTLPLDRFELRVAARLGQSAAVVGPSGAGKTALLESIAGLRPARGRVVVGGVTLQDTGRGLRLPPERRGLGYVPQDAALFPHLSVRRNLLFGARRPGPRQGGRRAGASPSGSAGDPEGELAELAAALDLEPLLARYPRHLSGGEARRVALGRALLARPRLLLLDEPTAGLDAERARRALTWIRALTRTGPIPLLVVTHRPEEAAALADEVLLLEEGRVRSAGPRRQVFRQALPGIPAGARGEEGPEGSWPGPVETLVEGAVLGHEPERGVTRVALREEGSLSIPWTPDLAPGAEILLAVGADEVLVATERPAGLSARNAVPTRLEALDTAGGAIYARAGDWTAHLTPEAVRELALAPGRPVWMVTKTHSWRVVAG
ncbi:MAG: ATP-binding cassette domain-containing protein [Thermoanaerobaculia bacterium]